MSGGGESLNEKCTGGQKKHMLTPPTISLSYLQGVFSQEAALYMDLRVSGSGVEQ